MQVGLRKSPLKEATSVKRKYALRNAYFAKEIYKGTLVSFQYFYMIFCIG